MATSYQEAVEKTIIASEQLNQIVNGTATAEVEVEGGSKIPSVRKALVDNFYFKDPLPWQQGQSESVFNQLRQLPDGTLWYAPTATTSNNVNMGVTPIGDTLWVLYSLDAIPKLTPQIRESLRRSYAEAGYTLVTGSFEDGGTLNSANDVLLQKSDGQAYSWLGSFPKIVSPNTSPSIGYISRAGDILRSQIASLSGSSLVGTSVPYPNAVVSTISDIVNGINVTLPMFGATPGMGDVTSQINNALISGAKIIDGLGLSYNISSTITVPQGVALINCHLVHTSVGGNMVEYSSHSMVINVTCIGSGSVSIVERGFYPASDGVTGALIDASASNLTVGLQLCPLTSAEPSQNVIHLKCTDIVGATGASEGYGVLLSPASDNIVRVIGKNIKRHALYLSAGASRNIAEVFCDGCGHHALSIYSIASQPACEDNTVTVYAKNLANPIGQSGLAVAAGITQKANRNTVYVTCHSDGRADHAVRLDGNGNASGPWPTDNEVHVNAFGTYLGNSVVFSGDCVNTMIIRPKIKGKAVNSLIQFYDSSANTYSPGRAGSVTGGVLDGMDSSNYGVANTAARGAVLVEGGIAYRNVLSPTKDYVSTSMGVNKSVTRTVRLENIQNNNYGSYTIALPERFVNPYVTPIVVSTPFRTDQVNAVVYAISEYSVTIDVWNRSGNTLTLVDVQVTISGE